MPEIVKVVGLKEFNKALRAMGGDLPKAVRLAFNKSADIVVQDARPRIPVVSGAAKGSVRVASTRNAARIRGGGGKAPYYPWLDFGGTIGKASGHEGGNHRPWIPDGRYIYNSFFRRRADFVTVMGDELQAIARRAGLELT